MKTVKLWADGRITIPAQIRAENNWVGGTRFQIIPFEHGYELIELPTNSGISMKKKVVKNIRTRNSKRRLS